MVKPLGFRQVLRANIHQDIQRVEHTLISGPHDGALLKLARVEEHSACEHLVAVESVTVGADNSLGKLLLELCDAGRVT